MAIKPVVQILDDESLCPFGVKYRGIKMKNIPASYYHWLWHNVRHGNVDVQAMRDYIERNIEAFKMENDDLIWEQDVS